MSIIITIWQFFYGISNFIVESVLSLIGLVFGVFMYILNMIGIAIDKIGLDSLVNEDVKKLFLFLLVGVSVLALAGFALKFGVQIMVGIVFIIPFVFLAAKIILTLIFVVMVAGISLSVVIAAFDLVKSKVMSV